MFFSNSQVTALDIDGLRSFLERGISENQQLDYKRALTGSPANGGDPINREAVQEFLKDVSALANANGGHLIIGCNEPGEGRPAADQIVGIDQVASVADRLDRAAIDGLDPRVPGLIVHPVHLDADRGLIVVHVPPSTSKPHMVNVKGMRSFFVRTTVSSVLMSTQDIRAAVLSSAASEDKAERASGRAFDGLHSGTFGRTAGSLLVIQAAPLIELFPTLDVDARVVIDAMCAEVKADYVQLMGDARGEPILGGVRVVSIYGRTEWLVELYRTGFMQIAFAKLDGQDPPPQYRESIPGARALGCFKAAAKKLAAVQQAAGAQVPMLISAVGLGMTGWTMRFNDVFGSDSGKCELERIELQATVARSPEDMEEVVVGLAYDFVRAFGLRRPVVTYPKEGFNAVNCRGVSADGAGQA